MPSKPKRPVLPPATEGDTSKVYPFSKGEYNKGVAALKNNKVIFRYVIEFIEENNILYEYQFGFRKNHSTSHAIITLVERVNKALDTGKYVVGVFIDLKKAFDTIDHGILMRKLELYGIQRNILNWFKAIYLTDVNM